MNRVASQGQSIGTLSECFKNKSCLRLKWADKKINGCLPSNWTRLSCTRINHASIFWSMGRTWFNSRKTKLCGHGEGNTPAVVKKKKVLCTPNLPDHPLSRHQIVQESGYFSNWKRHYLKGHTWGPGWFRWQWGVRAMRNFPPPPTPAEIWLSAACHQLSCRLTHTCTLKNKPTYKHTHQTDIVWMLHRSEPGQSLFWCKAFWEFCLPPSSFYFFLFPPSNCLVYFSRLTKSFSTAVTDVLDRTRVGLRDSLAGTEKRINRFLKDL